MISETEFNKRLNELADKNRNVRRLLEHFGSYDNLPKNVKSLVDIEIGVERETVIKER